MVGLGVDRETLEQLRTIVGLELSHHDHGLSDVQLGVIVGLQAPISTGTTSRASTTTLVGGFKSGSEL